MGYVGAGSMVSVLPIVTSACTSQATKQAVKTTVSAPRSDGFQVVGTVAALDKNTQLLVENVASKKVLVFRDSADPQKVIAINPTCPHAGCAVAWQKQEGLLVCPCHDSKFTPNGQVKQGPADEPLPTYIAKIETDTILVKVA